MKQHLNRNESAVPEKTESLPRNPLPPLVNHPAGKAAPGAVSRQTLCHCLPSQQAAARAMLEQTITDGSALKKLAEFVAAQDGDPAAIYDPSRLPMAPVQMEVPSPASGYVRHIAATDVGLVSMRLGGGRATKDSVIDHSVGIVLRKKVDEPVTAGESLATIHAADEAAARRAVAELAACYTITPDAPLAEPFIKAIIR